MRLKIFSCHHQIPQSGLSTEIYQTLVSGLMPGEGSGIKTDILGRNISDAQKFCELRHQYFVWQNLLSDYDYVGFEHYRRPFYIDPLPTDRLERDYPLLLDVRRGLTLDKTQPEVNVSTQTYRQFEELRRALTPVDAAAIKAWVSDHDVLFAFPMFEDVTLNFLRYHPDSEDIWRACLIAAQDLLTKRFRFPVVPAPWSGYLNMYIMRAEIFQEYMDFLFTLLLDLDRRYPHSPQRIWGHISERLFGAFLTQKALENPLLRWGHLPFLKEADSVGLPSS